MGNLVFEVSKITRFEKCQFNEVVAEQKNLNNLLLKGSVGKNTKSNIILNFI